MKAGDIVICINDSHLPQYAEVVKDREYEVEKFFINNWGQRCLYLKGVLNTATTDKGMLWNGYAAERFKLPDGVLQEEEKEVAYALN